MTTGDGPEFAATDAHGFQVPRLLRAAEVLCADGRVLRGRVFLPAAAESHPGAMRAEEWMNDPASFVPFLPDGEGRPVILNKQQITVVTVAASADHDEAMDADGGAGAPRPGRVRGPAPRRRRRSWTCPPTTRASSTSSTAPAPS